MAKVVELERKRKRDNVEGMIERFRKILEPGEKILEGESEGLLCSLLLALIIIQINMSQEELKIGLISMKIGCSTGY